MAETMLLWGIGLFAIAGLLLFLEVFLPSGGVIGAASAIAAIAGVVAFFRHSTMWGLSSILALMVLAPAAIAFAFKIWPNTPIGRRLILGDEDVQPDEETTKRIEKERAEREALLNATGVAVTDLRPGGAVQVGGKRYDALVEGPPLEAGEKIRVVGFETGQVKVRRAQ